MEKLTRSTISSTDILGTIEQLDDHFEIHSASLRPLYHSKRIETTRFVQRKSFMTALDKLLLFSI